MESEATISQVNCFLISIFPVDQSSKRNMIMLEEKKRILIMVFMGALCAHLFPVALIRPCCIRSWDNGKTTWHLHQMRYDERLLGQLMCCCHIVRILLFAMVLNVAGVAKPTTGTWVSIMCTLFCIFMRNPQDKLIFVLVLVLALYIVWFAVSPDLWHSSPSIFGQNCW